MAFSLEEKVDLLLKKVAFGKTKTNTSENTDGFGESIASPLLLRGDKVMKESASIPSTPAAVTNIVQAYQGADVVECTAATGTTDTNITGFKRAWTTGHTNWIPSEFSAAYTVEVYVGPTGWNGTDAIATTIGGTNGSGTGANVFRVVPGVQSANWFFDYQAGVLYWTNEDESGDVGGSEELTSSIASTDKVYIKGYKYIGEFGVGGTSDITGAATTIVTANLTDDLALISNGSGKVAVSTVTAAELAYVSGVTSAIQTQLTGIQNDVNQNESDADAAIAAVASDLSDYETSNDTAVAAKLALTGGTMTGDITFDAGQPKGNGGLVPAQGSVGHFLKHDGTFGSPSYTAAATQSDINGLAITTVGALDSGSITSNFGNIDNGSSTLNTGAATVASLVLGGHSINDIDITAEFEDDDAHIMSSKAIGARFALKNADTTGLATTATNIAGGAVGSVPYQGGSNSTAFLAGNTAATNLFMRSVGNGAAAAAPTFAAVTAADVGLGSVTNASQATIVAAAESSAASLYLPLTGGTISSNLTISGNLTVAGTVSQTNSTEVNFNDTRLRLNVPTGLMDGGIEDTAAPAGSVNVGLEVFNGAASNALSNGPLWVYNYSTDHWGASVQGSETTLDNVKAFKFDVTTTGLGAEANGTNDVADLYATATTARSNNSNVRSVGAVSKCTIDITTDSGDSPDNFAPVAAAANGYPIQHDLATSSVFVFALKTHQAGGAGTGGTATVITEPQPIFCKFKVLTSDIVEVSVGITLENEKYDIIVIG